MILARERGGLRVGRQELAHVERQPSAPAAPRREKRLDPSRREVAADGVSKERAVLELLLRERLQELGHVRPGARRHVVEGALVRLDEPDDPRVQVPRLGPCEPRAAVRPHRRLEEPRAERLVERRHVVLGALRVHRRDAHPAVREHVLVEASRRQQLQRGLLDVALCAVELLEEEDPGSVPREHVRQRVLGAPILHDGEPHEVGGLEEAQVEHNRLDRERLRHAPHDLALADPRRPLEEHRATGAVGDPEHPLEPRPDGDRERPERLAGGRLLRRRRHDGRLARARAPDAARPRTTREVEEIRLAREPPRPHDPLPFPHAALRANRLHARRAAPVAPDRRRRHPPRRCARDVPESGRGDRVRTAGDWRRVSGGGEDVRAHEPRRAEARAVHGPDPSHLRGRTRGRAHPHVAPRARDHERDRPPREGLRGERGRRSPGARAALRHVPPRQRSPVSGARARPQGPRRVRAGRSRRARAARPGVPEAGCHPLRGRPRGPDARRLRRHERGEGARAALRAHARVPVRHPAGAGRRVDRARPPGRAEGAARQAPARDRRTERLDAKGRRAPRVARDAAAHGELTATPGQAGVARAPGLPAPVRGRRWAARDPSARSRTPTPPRGRRRARRGPSPCRARRPRTEGGYLAADRERRARAEDGVAGQEAAGPVVPVQHGPLGVAGDQVHFEARHRVAVLQGAVDLELCREVVLDLPERALEPRPLGAEPSTRRPPRQHVRVGPVRVDLHAERPLQPRGVACVVGVTVGQEHAGHVGRAEPRRAQLLHELPALGPVTRIDEPAVARPAVEEVHVRHEERRKPAKRRDHDLHRRRA